MQFEMPSSRTLLEVFFRVYSCWEKEIAVKKPSSTLDKAVLEGDPRGDGEEIISYLRHLQYA